MGWFLWDGSCKGKVGIGNIRGRRVNVLCCRVKELRRGYDMI